MANVHFISVELFAFGFASPWLLGGLALAAIPIALHFFFKRQFRETPWAAMRFLLEAARKHSRRLRLEQLLLLAVRVMILGFLALALARPYAELVGGGGESVVPTHRIFVLDSSFSMGFREAGTTRFERGQAIIRENMDDARGGDIFNLARICGDSPHVVIGEPSTRADQVVAEVDSLRPTDERGDVVAALRQIAELAALAPDVTRKQVFIVSDFQRDNWHPEAAGGSAEMRRLLDLLGSRAEVVFLDAKQGPSPNLAVTNLESTEPVPIIGRDVPLRGVVRNFGSQPLLQQRIEIHVDGRLTDARSLDLPPGTDVPIEFQQLFRESGEHVIELKLADDGLPIDNQRQVVLPIRDEVNLLLVNGRPTGKPTDAATYYLETVLAPTTSRDSWSGSTQPRVIGDGELIQQNLNRFDCVCLSNVRMFTDREASLLRSYVAGGGGLLIWLGDQVQTENYNQVLFRDGNGVLPASLVQRVGSARNASTAFGFDVESLEHPVLRRFRGNPGTGLETTLTLEYFKTAAEIPKTTRVALRYQNGDPAILESQIGQGRVLLVTTAADASWGTWPVQRSFPPLVHELVRFAIAGRLGNRQGNVGEPIVRIFSSNEMPASVNMIRPDERKVALNVAAREEAATISFADTDRSGVYQMLLGAPVNRTEKFAVHLDPRESDLASISPEELKPAPSEVNAATARVTAEETRPVIATEELSHWLLLSALCLLFVEQLMAWKFELGFALLLLVVAAALTRHSFVWHPVAGVVAAVVFVVLIGVLVAVRRRGLRRVSSA